MWVQCPVSNVQWSTVGVWTRELGANRSRTRSCPCPPATFAAGSGPWTLDPGLTPAHPTTPRCESNPRTTVSNGQSVCSVMSGICSEEQTASISSCQAEIARP